MLKGIFRQKISVEKYAITKVCILDCKMFCGCKDFCHKEALLIEKLSSL